MRKPFIQIAGLVKHFEMGGQIVRALDGVDVEIEAARPLVDGSVHVTLKDGAVVYHDRDGALIKGLILAEADPKVDFNDFLALAGVFGSREGDADFDFRADLNVDRKIDFADPLRGILAVAKRWVSSSIRAVIGAATSSS